MAVSATGNPFFKRPAVPERSSMHVVRPRQKLPKGVKLVAVFFAVSLCSALSFGHSGSCTNAIAPVTRTHHFNNTVSCLQGEVITPVLQPHPPWSVSPQVPLLFVRFQPSAPSTVAVVACQAACSRGSGECHASSPRW